MAVNKTKRTTRRIVEQTDSIKSYWKDSRKYKPLTAEEERALFEKYPIASMAEKKRIQNTLVMCNQRIIYSKALDFTKDPDLIQDYIREGSIGLLKAIDKFDVNMGVKFITFAIDYIYREMYEYNSKFGSLVRRSNDKKIGVKIKGIRDEFYTREERDPTSEELKDIFKKKYDIEIKEDVDLLDVNMSSIDDTGEQSGNDIDIDQTESGEFAVSTASLNGFIEQEEMEHTNRLVNALLSKLSERDREIVSMFYGIGYDYAVDPDDIASKFGISRTRVNQIIASSLKQMRNFC